MRDSVDCRIRPAVRRPELLARHRSMARPGKAAFWLPVLFPDIPSPAPAHREHWPRPRRSHCQIPQRWTSWPEDPSARGRREPAGCWPEPRSAMYLNVFWFADHRLRKAASVSQPACTRRHRNTPSRPGSCSARPRIPSRPPRLEKHEHEHYR